MSLAPFLNKHAGETAWLFGKGPSFSNFDFSTAGPLRVAINDVADHVPDCVYCFANDGVERWCDAYREGQILFQPERALAEFDSRGAIDCDVVTYEDVYEDDRMAMGRQALAEHPAIRRGTLGSALQILHVMGVGEIHLVGIDGGGSHAPGIKWRTRLRNDHRKDYNAIRNAAIDAADLMGLTLHFHNTKEIMSNNGKLYVKFTRNAMVQAEPYSQGEIASFNPRQCEELISARAAIYFEKPEEPVIETAEAPMTARENATIPTKKTKRKR